LASRHKKGKRENSKKQAKLIVVLVIAVTIFLFLILTAKTILGVIVGGLHGREVHGAKRGKRIIIKRWHWERKLVKLIKSHLLVLVPLVA
jgi:hypothetical protein